VALPAPADERAALITGASSGIGEAIALELARRGYQPVLVARGSDRMHALAGTLSTKAHVLPADLSSRTDRAALPDRVAALGLAPDILINNAGLADRALVAKSVPEQQLNLVEVDVAAVVDVGPIGSSLRFVGLRRRSGCCPCSRAVPCRRNPISARVDARVDMPIIGHRRGAVAQTDRLTPCSR
jgi:NAD(P)-dependent dehydrogenase (short-subunit alcohol dehydrogenase family)